MESLKAELIPAEVYVFTPKGSIIVLPHKATALDFAFAIHTDVGLSTSRVRVNGNIEALNFRLQSGQIIEVITSDSIAPDSRWLEFVVTIKARNCHSAILKTYRVVRSRGTGALFIATSLDKLSTPFVGHIQITHERSFRILKIKEQKRII